MQSGMELVREIKLTDWSIAGNLSNRSSGVQIPRDICTRLKALFVLCEVLLDNNYCYKMSAYMKVNIKDRMKAIQANIKMQKSKKGK